MGWDRDRAKSFAAGALEPDQAPRTLALAALGIGLVVSLVMNLPGHMSYDSVLQLAQGRSGVYNNWHPPVMAWLLGVFDGLVRGTALFVLFNSLLLYGALALLVCAPARSTWIAAPLLIVWAAIPNGLIYPGIVWKDVLFAATALGGFTGLVLTARLWPRRRWRFVAIVGSFLLLSLAALTRQNGLVVLPAAAVALGWIAARSGHHKPIHSAIAYALLPLGGAILVMLAANAGLQTRSDGEPSTIYELEDLQAYDLAAALQAKPDLELGRLKTANPTLERLLRTRAAPLYTPERLDAISGMPELDKALFDTPIQDVSGQWRQLVLGHPWLYLKIRARDFFWVLATPDIDVCLPFFDGVSGPEPWVTRLGLKNRERPQDLALKAWGEPWSHSPLSSHLLYLAVDAMLLGLLLIRRRTTDIAIAGLLAAALLFVATFFLISVACDYRYLYFLDVAAIAAGVYVVADPSDLRLRRPRPAGP
jgi:hypothetical protein